MRLIVAVGLLVTALMPRSLSGRPPGTSPPISEQEVNRLGITGTTYFVTTPIPFPAESRGRGTAKGNHLTDRLVEVLWPGWPARMDLLPTGWIIWVKEGSPLYKAGIRTGDVITRIGAKRSLTIEDEIGPLLTKNLSTKECVVVGIRHFREGFWTTKRCKGKKQPGNTVTSSSASWYQDHEILLRYQDHEILLLPLPRQ
jgi:hypothetical protein